MESMNLNQLKFNRINNLVNLN